MSESYNLKSEYNKYNKYNKYIPVIHSQTTNIDPTIFNDSYNQVNPLYNPMNYTYGYILVPIYNPNQDIYNQQAKTNEHQVPIVSSGIQSPKSNISESEFDKNIYQQNKTIYSRSQTPMSNISEPKSLIDNFDIEIKKTINLLKHLNNNSKNTIDQIKADALLALKIADEEQKALDDSKILEEESMAKVIKRSIIKRNQEESDAKLAKELSK
jgi:hypothetical protein